MTKYITYITTLLFVSPCFANLQIFPTRVQLSPSNKTATISVRLRSNKPETFRISTMFYQMSYDGSMKQRPDLSRISESAASYLRFSPKRVTLQPNVEQVIRIRIKNIGKLKNEVRTHLYFRPAEKPRNLDPITKNMKKSAFELKAQIAVAIPVIVSPKPIAKDFALNNFKVFKKDGETKFKVDLIKKTKGFLYGDVKVYKVKGKKKKLVSAAKGISSYIPKRSISYSFLQSPKAPLEKGLYQIEFNEYSGKTLKKGLKKSLNYNLL